MTKMIKSGLFIISILLICFSSITLKSWSKTAGMSEASDYDTDSLYNAINKLIKDYTGEIGVALIINNRDTITVNNKNAYPMMSVFKLHQALAICKVLDNKGTPLDSVITIYRNQLDAETWSPMMKERTDDIFSLSIKDLLHYTLTLSDNNASNILFKSLVSIAETDSIISTIIPRNCFEISYTEEEMKSDHNKAYANRSSPLGAAILINRIFTDSLTSPEKQDFIKYSLEQCATGNDRISAPLHNIDGIGIAHKTGSGYRTGNGLLTAHNDVAYIRINDNLCYSLAVFVKDFNGDESQASDVISCISKTVYTFVSKISSN